MQRTPLLTDFVCIATAGATVDGREITSTQLQEMAESYDPALYTANIWLEHYRWRNFGQVVALEVREESGKTKLYAKLAPSFEMLELNRQGQKIFTSVEMTPNFAGSGKYYLSGLGITDSPASTGTTALMFSRIGSEAVLTGAGEPLLLHFTEQEGSDEADATALLRSIFGWLFKQSPQKAKIEPTLFATSGTQHEKETEKMTKEDIEALVETAVAAAFAKQSEPAQADEKTPNETESVSREEFNALQAQHQALQEKFNALSKTEVTEVPHGAGGMTRSAQAFAIDTAI